jgi:hypothetical protein
MLSFYDGLHAVPTLHCYELNKVNIFLGKIRKYNPNRLGHVGADCSYPANWNGDFVLPVQVAGRSQPQLESLLPASAPVSGRCRVTCATQGPFYWHDSRFLLLDIKLFFKASLRNITQKRELLVQLSMEYCYI